MKLNYENIYTLSFDEAIKERLKADLKDIDEINEMSGKKFFINYQDYHDEYSPERTDPCPDYYEYFTIREEAHPYDIIGPECASEYDLEDVIMTISNTISALYGEEPTYYDCGEEVESIIKEYNENKIKN
jgi:hypothetical protein